jgi:signal peptidase I
LMGDNRPQSRDSRYFGPVPESRIVGRAFVRIWPLSRLAFL